MDAWFDEINGSSREGPFIAKKIIILISSIILFAFTLPSLVPAQDKFIQDIIEKAAPGDQIKLDEGQYDEEIVIDKPIHLIGGEETTFIQKNKNPVITINADHVTLENLSIIHEDDYNHSAAILINSDNNTLQRITIHTTSYGIQLDEANKNKIYDVTITGDQDKPMNERKHGIDLWKSNNNEIYDSSISHVQDSIYIEKSNNTRLFNNQTFYSRYGTHLMFTKNTVLEQNESYENVSGFYVMGAQNTVIKNNTLKNNRENVQSIGLFVFDTKNATITNNQIENNRIGFFLEDAEDNSFTFNNVQNNYVGIQFKKAKNNVLTHNAFVANIVQGQALESNHNTTNENYWGDHLGLDMHGQNMSSLPYKVDPFFMSVINEYPVFQLLFQSPGMVFLEDLIQIPVDVQLVDASPLMTHPLVVTKNKPSHQLAILFLCFSLLLISIMIIYLGVRKQ